MTIVSQAPVIEMDGRRLYYTFIAGARGFVFFVEGIIDFIGIILWIIGFCFEAGGDIQLAKFKSDPANKGSIMDKGLWRYTRHPNYFGDSTIWLGYGFLCLSSGSYLPVIGSLLMIVLIIKVSGVALLEKSLKVKKPQYKEYIEKTNAFIPWFPKRPPIQ